MSSSAASSSARQLLQAARLVPHPAAKQCANPTRPVPLRRLPASATDPVVELLVAQHGPHPCCILPHTPARGMLQSRGLFSLIRLDTLDDTTLVGSLAAVEGHVANICAACPNAAAPPAPAHRAYGAAAAAALQQQQAAAEAPRPSPLVYSPQFNAYIERCLELARGHLELGPAPAVLLMQIVSRLHYAADDSLRESFNRFYLHLRILLESAVEVHAEAVTPQVSLALYEAWAALGVVPMKSRAFGLAVRQHIKLARFTPQELTRLLAAMAALRRAQPSYRPCQYDVADMCGLLAGGLPDLNPQQLASVAASLGAFPWPVYQCVVPLLHATAQEAVHRSATGALSPPGTATTLGAALASACALSPRVGADLEAAVAGWQAQARVATGNILRFGERGVAAAHDGGAASLAASM